MVLKVKMEKEIEQKFREVAMRRYGYAKGSLQKATREALRAWVAQQGRGTAVAGELNKLFGIAKRAGPFLRDKKTREF